MYSIVMSRPSYSGNPTYRVKVDTLSDVAALIENDCNRSTLAGSRVLRIENLSNRERIILWRKCYAIENRIENKTDEMKLYRLNNLHRIFRKSN